MKSGWIKAVAIIFAICAGIYLIYATVMFITMFKDNTAYIVLSVSIAIVSYAIIFMFIGAIYRIGTLTDYVNNLEITSIQTDIKEERRYDDLETRIEELEIKMNKVDSSVQEIKSSASNKCPNCGKEIEEDFVFCVNCGTKL